MFYSVGDCVILSPGNSPNRHMAGEEFWRGTTTDLWVRAKNQGENGNGNIEYLEKIG